MVTLGVLFGFGVYDLEGRTIVPLAGIVVGNSLSATVLVSRQLFTAASKQRIDIEGRLALGLSASAAFQPHLRQALRTALVPQIESTKAVGIIALPGAMVGLILAGVEPVDAVRVQLSVMYLVLGSVATTTAVMSFGISRRLFTERRSAAPLRRPGLTLSRHRLRTGTGQDGDGCGGTGRQRNPRLLPVHRECILDHDPPADVDGHERVSGGDEVEERLVADREEECRRPTVREWRPFR